MLISTIATVSSQFKESTQSVQKSVGTEDTVSLSGPHNGKKSLSFIEKMCECSSPEKINVNHCESLFFTH